MTTHLISYVHSGLSLICEIAPSFSPLKIYIPWGGAVPECVDGAEIIASYPPEGLKPDVDMEPILNECFSWANEQGETSRREIIKTGHINPTSDESLRHIKTILARRISSDTSERNVKIKWHMLLHLANRLEENRKEANRMLEDLKKKPSPLVNNADLTEKTMYPLESLTGIDVEFFLSDRNTEQLLRAWHGLFNSYITDDDLLLTVDRHIFEHLSREWDVLCSDNSIQKSGIISFECPLLKRADNNDRELSNKTAIVDNILNIAGSDIKNEDKISALSDLAAAVESKYQAEPGDDRILFSIFYFQPMEISKNIEKDIFLKFFSGKILILAEINA